MVKRVDAVALNTKQQDINTSSAQKNNDEPKKPIELVKEDKTSNIDKPVEGYYIDKTDNESNVSAVNASDSDDELDTSIDTSVVSVNPSIAINDASNGVMEAMDIFAERAASDLLIKSSSDDNFYKAQGMIESNSAYKSFEELDYKKKFTGYGKVVYENTNYKKRLGNDESGVDCDYRTNTVRVDLGMTWRNKSGSTKVFGFGSYTGTKSEIIFPETSLLTPEGDEGKSYSEAIEIYPKHDSYSIYGAAQHKFKNGDKLIGSGSHINKDELYIKMTAFEASYYLKKYMVLAEAKTSLIKFVENSSVSKTDFKVSLNPELALEQPKKEVKAQPDSNIQQNSVQEVQVDSKKWQTAWSPFFDTQTINGHSEEGLGLQFRVKKNISSSKFRVATFGKVSTTQQEESSKYHLTFGANLKYSKKINTKSLLKAEADVKERYTFGEGNIVTARGKVRYTSPKLSAEIEAKAFSAPVDKDKNLYFGAGSRLYYTPNKHLNLFTELYYGGAKVSYQSEMGSRLQIGVIGNF